ncbi:MAG: sigma-70 family RNA polymerase sigma factor [Deltaproteobacteria bacterium]|nr:sigma-70 family RNA polymerase sigma factor [Deltaproteobacteria bacterium]
MAETAPSTDELLQHTDWLTQLARALVGDAHAADVVQETYEVALTSPPKQKGALRPWLGGVARNLARMTTRTRMRRERREDAVSDIAPEVPTPAQLVERVQMNQQVAKIVLELPEPLRATLLLRFFEGMTAADIARAQGVPPATVRGRIKDALDRVRATLDQQHGDRKRWVALVAPLPLVTAADATAAIVAGGLVVKSGKIVIALVVVIAAVLGTRWLGWWGGKGDKPDEGSGSAAIVVDRGSATQPPASLATASRSAPSREQMVFDDDPKGKLRIEGQVIDEKDQGVAGAQVAIDSNPPMVVTTEQGGNFVFEGLIPRDYRLEATGGDGYAGPARLRLTEKVEPVTLRMRKGGMVEVDVTDGAKPIAGAEVELRSILLWTAKTDAKGIATLRGVGSVWAPLHVKATGFAPTAQMVSWSGDPAQPKQISIVLERGAGISGRVVDPDGKPVAEARVVATSASEPFPVVDPRRDGVLSSADGTFAIPTVAAGTWRLTASHPQHGPATSAPITVDGARAQTNVELKLEAGGTVKGKVVDTNGKPVASAEVRVVVRGHLFWRARRQALTDTEGTFVVSALPLRAMDVVASHETGASAIASADLSEKRDVDVTMTLDLTGAIEGVVVDKAGQPVGDAQVIASPVWSGNTVDQFTWSVRGIQEAVTDQGGAFKLTGMPTGEYRVRAGRPGASEEMMSLAAPVTAKPGGPKLRLTITNDGRVIGKVALPDGKAPGRFFVRIGEYGMPFASSDGAFALPVATGKHSISISGPGFVEKWQPDVVVTEGKDTDLGTITVTPGRSISGRVLDPSGTPVAKATVAAGALLTGGGKELYIATESPGAKNTETDKDGRFVLEGFNTGPITVVAGKADVGRSGSIRVPPGPTSATLELVLAPTSSVEGRIVRDGKPVGDVVIIANPIGAVGSNFFTTTGADGTFALDAIAPDDYIVYPMFGGGGPRPKDIYTRRVVVSAGKRAKVEIDATPGPLAIEVSVKNADGSPAMAQVITVEAAIEVGSLEEFRDGAWRTRLLTGTQFSDAVIPVYMRAHMGGPIEITIARPGTHTTCAMGMAGMSADSDLSKAPFKCQQYKLEAGQPKRQLELTLTKPKM